MSSITDYQTCQKLGRLGLWQVCRLQSNQQVPCGPSKSIRCEYMRKSQKLRQFMKMYMLSLLFISRRYSFFYFVEQMFSIMIYTEKAISSARRFHNLFWKHPWGVMQLWFMSLENDTSTIWMLSYWAHNFRNGKCCKHVFDSPQCSSARHEHIEQVYTLVDVPVSDFVWV